MTNLTFNASGEVMFTSSDGSRHTVHPSGTERIVTRDGATIELDVRGRTTRVSVGTAFTRELRYDGDNLVGVVENRNGVRTVWTRRRRAGGPGYEWANNRTDEIRTGLTESQGTLTWTSSDTSTIVEMPNFSNVVRVGDRVVTLTTRNGATRTFRRGAVDGHLLEITDTRPARPGAAATVTRWLAQAGPDGPSSTMARVDSTGRVLAAHGRRTNIVVRPDGSYQYRDSNGRTHIDYLEPPPPPTPERRAAAPTRPGHSVIAQPPQRIVYMWQNGRLVPVLAQPRPYQYRPTPVIYRSPYVVPQRYYYRPGGC
jgi:hypothetical protein